ncbi:MAG TPA: hypothetical protein VIV12_23285 [Streptosporangiaceae bacterium]
MRRWYYRRRYALLDWLEQWFGRARLWAAHHRAATWRAAYPAHLDLAYLFGRTRVSGQTMRASSGGPNPFLRALSAEMAQIRADAAAMDARERRALTGGPFYGD